MDQSKWSVPRQRVVQSCKEVNGLVRPRVKIHAVWAHQIGLHLFVCHPTVAADSSLILECLNRVLETTHQKFIQKGKAFPEQPFCWAPLLSLIAFIDRWATVIVGLSQTTTFAMRPD